MSLNYGLISFASELETPTFGGIQPFAADGYWL